jgi:hypothetical protein
MFFKRFIVVLSLVCVFIPSLALSASDFGLTESSKAANLPQGEVDLMVVVANVIGTALSLVGVIFMILFIYGGFLWMTAAGDSGNTKKAKDLMTSAVIGAVLIFSAYFITKFVVNELVSSTTIQSGAGAPTPTDTGTPTTPTTTTPTTPVWD